MPSGRIHVVAREPLTGFLNFVNVERDTSEEWADRESVTLEAKDNAINVQHVPPGDYMASVRTAAGSVGALVRLESGAPEARVELGRPRESGWIAGTLREGRSELGEMDGVSAQPIGYYFPRYFAKINRTTGFYRLTDLPPGTYVVSGSSHSEDRTPSHLSYSVLAEVRAGHVARIDLNVPPARQIRFVPQTQWPTQPRWRVHTPTGVWLFYTEIAGSDDLLSCWLAAGDYLVEADFREHGRVRQTFTITPGEGVLEVPLASPPARSGAAG
ncbi:MAG: hypothetical protein AB1716_02815 [Planctomycetota bacterium]